MGLKKEKRGIAEIVTWILLLGFAVVLAVSIFVWQKSQTEELTKESVQYLEGKLECEDISINIIRGEDCSRVGIVNKGKFTIDAIKAREKEEDIEIIPIRHKEGKLTGCIDRAVLLSNCGNIDSLITEIIEIEDSLKPSETKQVALMP